MNKFIQQLSECLDQLEYLEPEHFDDDEHKRNWNEFLDSIRATIHNPYCKIYCVEREGGDGIEQDIFLDEELANEWARYIGGRRYNEYTIDRHTLNDMKDNHEPNTIQQ